MLDTFSKTVIYKKLPPPYKQTLFVEMVRFVPGQPDNLPVNGPARMTGTPMTHQGIPMSPMSHSHDVRASASMAVASSSSFASSSVPPPPPWSRWGTVATPSRPPSTQHRQLPDGTPTSPPPSLPPLSSAAAAAPTKKRKHPDDPDDDAPLSPLPSPKRHAMPRTPIVQPTRPVQTLSPSLAMIVSPTDQPPRPSAYLGSPSMRNGNGNGVHPVNLVAPSNGMTPTRLT